jgi:hypothetical protein
LRESFLNKSGVNLKNSFELGISMLETKKTSKTLVEEY